MNMQNLMAQAQRMQREIQKKQEEIYKTKYIGESEWIKVTVMGNKSIVSVVVKYEGDLNADKEMLSDMITIAINDAFKKIEADIDSKLGMYSKQLGGLM